MGTVACRWGGGGVISMPKAISDHCFPTMSFTIDHSWAFNSEACAQQRVAVAVAAGDTDRARREFYCANELSCIANGSAALLFPLPVDEDAGLEELAAVERQRMEYNCKMLGIEVATDRWGIPTQELTDTLSRWFYRCVNRNEFSCPLPYPMNEYNGD